MYRLRVFGLATALVACLLAIAGCGTKAAAPEPQVQLQLTTPVDGTTVTDGSITIAGKVSPAGTRVLVLGQPVTVTGGEFTKTVPLQPGSNLVDVLAGGDRARAAMTAVRVYRQVLVTIPNVSNDSPSTAVRALEALGLHARTDNTDSFLDFLIPSSYGICSMSPAPGNRVLPGTLVTIKISKTC
jgi:hypothetical protein